MAAKLSLIGYASGNFGKNMLWSAADLTILYLFTDVMRFTPSVAGAMVGLSLLVNLVLDPVMGRYGDLLSGPLGGKRAMMMLGAPVAASGFALLYALPGLGLAHLEVAAAALILFRIGFAMLDAPHNGLLAVIAVTDTARVQLSGMRFAFSSLATLFGLVLVPILIEVAQNGRGGQLALVGLGVAAAAGLTIILSALASRRWDLPAARWALATPPRRAHGHAVLTRPILLLLALICIANIGLPIFGKMMIFHGHGPGSDTSGAPILLVTMIVGQLVGISLWTSAAKRFSSERMLSAALAAAGLSALAALVVPLTLATFAFGVASGGVWLLIWPLVATLSDDFARTTDTRRAGFIFGLAIVAIKAGQAIGAMLVGAMLASVGYRADASASIAMSHMIQLMQALGPCVAVIAALLLMRRTARAAR